MLMRRMRMEKTPRTGSSATASDATMLRSALIRPKMRRTRTARRLTTRPGDWPLAAAEATETATTAASRRFQGQRTKGRSQWAKALTASSREERATKRRLRRSRACAMGVSCEPVALVMYSASRMVQTKFCRVWANRWAQSSVRVRLPAMENVGMRCFIRLELLAGVIM
jgi:hypothetical protein